MAIPVNITDLINRTIVESSRVEFKADWNPGPILHTICAFANDIDNMGGGYIVVGVEEKDGSPVFPIKGIARNRIDGMEKKLREICNYLEPFYQPVAEQFIFKGNTRLEYEILSELKCCRECLQRLLQIEENNLNNN